MSKRAKRVDQLSRDDLDKFPVWRFVNDDSDELLVRPVTRIPIPNPSGHLLGTWLVLANGTRARALLGNVDVTDPRGTQHFLSVSIERDGRWFNLSRYFDADYSGQGPAALARFLSLTLDDVFPITFDIRDLVQGAPQVASGIIPLEPTERLSRAELIARAVP